MVMKRTALFFKEEQLKRLQALSKKQALRWRNSFGVPLTNIFMNVQKN
jgi:hypothetical protein